MRLTGWILVALLFSAGWTGGAARPGADFQEIYELLKMHLAGVNESELEQAAVEGLITELYPHVAIVTNGPARTNTGTLAATSILEGAYGYFRFNGVADEIDKEFNSAFKRLASTNKLKGIVLDLRFARGEDYPAAAALADGFFSTRQPLVDWGDGMKFSSQKTNAMSLPVAILVNNETAGSAEAFAGMLRRSEIGLLIGDNTAGQASLSREFTLKNRQKLRVATTPVKIAGGQTIDRRGLSPDIAVEVSPTEERAFLQDAYRVTARSNGTVAGTNQVAGASTNRQPRRRLNEAELVRMQREGIDFDEFVPGRDAGPARPPVITDPALARALDLLKGLAVVHRFGGF
jgi:hypothetical protein